MPELTARYGNGSHGGMSAADDSKLCEVIDGSGSDTPNVRAASIHCPEPSIVAINKNNGEVEAVGKEAKEMLGRTPGNIVAIKPMKDGVIADFKVTERMLNYFIQKAHGRKMLVHPRIVIGVPSEITQVEKRAV